MDNKKTAICYAITAAVCYGVSAPAAKLLLTEVPTVMMAAFLYLGAGAGMGLIRLRHGAKSKEAKIAKQDLPYIAAVITLDIAASIFIVIGLTVVNPATVSLLNNFEIVATAIFALAIFKETAGKRMWAALALVSIASVILSVENFGEISISPGAALVILACVCWGFENNCTRMMSLKDPIQIVIVKGFGSGMGSLAIAVFISESFPKPTYMLMSLLLGFLSYGLSVYFYILAQRGLGAARTGAYYAFAPFVGVGLSFAIFGQQFSAFFWVALALMIAGSYFAVSETHNHSHTHEELEHEHRHNHADGHHGHMHQSPVKGEHTHIHKHNRVTHTHSHMPDLHHVHKQPHK